MTLQNGICPDERRNKLKQLLKENKYIRVIEAHDGISGLIGNNTKSYGKEFHALWESSLCDSASKGYPDTEVVGFDSRLNTLRQILDVTNKPIIFDGDTGGDIQHFEYMVRRLETSGVSAIIIEDKKFPKENSLKKDAIHHLEDIDIFCEKIKRGKKILLTENFMIIARLESLIADKGQEDAIKRAKAYLTAGADGIMIHSKKDSPNEILEFSENYKKLCEELGFRKPLICVPTTYNRITEEELAKQGFNIIIHANHLLRSSVKTMQEVCESILNQRRSYEVDSSCVTMHDILEKVGLIDKDYKDKTG